jgi:hypothetical protein
LIPRDGTYLPLIKKYKLKDLKMFKQLTQLEDEYEWADWWVWRYYFKKKARSKLVEVEDYGFTEEYSRKIGYSP